MNLLDIIQRKKNAFTLLELLFVIIFIAILGGLLIPAISSTRERSRRVKCASNLHQIGVAILLYSQNHSDNFPNDAATTTINGSMQLLADQLNNQGSLFFCPSDKVKRPTNDLRTIQNNNISYCYVQKLTTNTKARMPVLFDPIITQWNLTIVNDFNDMTWPYKANHGTDGGNILFCDGHVQFMNKFPNFMAGAVQGYAYYEIDAAPTEAYLNKVLFP